MRRDPLDTWKPGDNRYGKLGPEGFLGIQNKWTMRVLAAAGVTTVSDGGCYYGPAGLVAVAAKTEHLAEVSAVKLIKWLKNDTMYSAMIGAVHMLEGTLSEADVKAIIGAYDEKR